VIPVVAGSSPSFTQNHKLAIFKEFDSLTFPKSAINKAVYLYLNSVDYELIA